MTRVLQAIAGGPHGGAERQFVRLALALHRAGTEQRILIRRDPERAAALAAGGLKPVELAFGGPFDLLSGPRFRREVAAFAPEIVLTWMNRATRFCPAARGGRGFVHAARLGGYYDLKYYRRCDHLIGNTPDIVDYLRRAGWPAARTHYLPNVVPAEPAAALDRAAFTTPDGANLALALGRLHANKGFDVLLHALAELPGLWLWIAGDGPLDGALKRLAEGLGVGERVRFLGWREDTAALLATADVLVVPSRHEPFGNALVEAWAQRVPVVAAASAGPVALVRPEENGLLVPVEDAPALAAAIGRVIGDAALAERLVEGGWESYRAGYTEAVAVSVYRAFFDRVLRGRPCRAGGAGL